MQPLRGFLMLVAASIAFYRGWKMMPSPHAWIAFGLGVLAIGLALWHLTRPSRSLGLPTSGRKRM
jgi:hypothetical protein